MEPERTFMVKFNMVEGNIQTQMQNKNVSLQEALGLLDMAKFQILETLAKGKKEVFTSTGTPKE